MTVQNVPIDWQQISWPLSNLSTAIEAVAQQGETAVYQAESIPIPFIGEPTQEALTHWLDNTAAQLGVEIQAVEVPYPDAQAFLQTAAPAILHINHPNSSLEEQFIVLMGSSWRSVTVLCPDFTTKKIPIAQLREAWCYNLEIPLTDTADRFLGQLGLSGGKRARGRMAVAADILGDQTLSGCWFIYHPPSTSLWKQIKRVHLIRPFLMLVGTNIAQQIMVVAAWAVIGRGVLEGRFDRGWLIAWALMMITAIFFQALLNQIQGPFAVSIIRFFKERLLQGSLQLDPEEIRTQGSGQFLGRVLESDMVQNFIIGGAVLALPFVTILLVAGFVLYFGAAGWIHVILLILWIIAAAIFGRNRFREGDAGMEVYRHMTNDLVERMMGHKTRLAQASRLLWHEDEDKSLNHYIDLSRLFDLSGVNIDILIPRGWLVLGIAGFAYAFIFTSASITKLAISVGGILLAYQAFESLAQSMKFMAQALMSWRQVLPLLQAAARPPQPPIIEALLPHRNAAVGEQQPLIMMRDLTFRYRDRGKPVLENCGLTIHQGDRLLLEGPSGGGKSTLAAVLSSLRTAESGLLLLWGFDIKTLGQRTWRKRVVFAPQFQENHVFTETLAFNLLMGRRWPPTATDLQAAEQICRELGLGELIDRMSEGLQQTVGEGGWMLSHGERSRLYIARALLQQADLVILDESFGALDPESLNIAMRCVLAWSPTLLVIAHP